MNSGTNQHLYGLGRYLDGSIYCCGREGVLIRLQDNSWVNTPNTIYQYNRAGDAILDTLDRQDDLLSLTTITEYGIAGDTGRILMDDGGANWQLKLVADEEWVTSGWSDQGQVSGNFLATDNGRLYQLSFADDVYSWGEISSPIAAPLNSTIYDMWTADSDTFFFVTQEGQIARRSLDGNSETLYDGTYMLYGIWGTANDDIYAVGVGGTFLHFDGNEWTDVPIEIDKYDHDQPSADKFGRPLR
jgi:hypothetical protein